MRAWADLSLMSLTFLFTIIWNVEVGIAVSFVISLLLVVHRSSKTRMTILVRYVLLIKTSYRPTADALPQSSSTMLHHAFNTAGTNTRDRPMEANR